MSITKEQTALINKLRYMGKQYAGGQFARGGGRQKHYLEEAADEIERLAAAQSQPLVEPTAALDVDLPDRVIDQLMHDAGVSLMEPWSEQEMYDFANTVKREVLARVPSKMLAASPQHQVKKGELS